MEIKYAISLILLGYLLLIGACWKFFIIPKMKFLEQNQNPKTPKPQNPTVLKIGADQKLFMN